MPRRVDLPQVAAHYAISSLFERAGPDVPTYCYSVERVDYDRWESGRARLAVGRARVTSQFTEESALLTFAVLHLGDHNLNAGVRPGGGEQEFAALAREASQAFLRGDIAASIRLLDHHFGASAYSLRSLFHDEQRRIVDLILDSVLRDAESTYGQLYEHHGPLMRFLSDLNLPAPRALHLAAEFVLNAGLRREFSSDDPDLDRASALLGAACVEKVTLDAPGLAYVLKGTLERIFVQLAAQPADLELLERLVRIDRKSTRLNSSHIQKSRMPSSA